MRALPTGTVTFLFTDVEGSTRLLQEHGEGYADLLAAHRRALRDAFAWHGGVEVDTQGDAFFIAFARASDALAEAEEAQRALTDGPVRVRIGVHTGEPVTTDEGYVGIDVHRAARIAAAGHGGQILVSQSTRDLAGVEGLRDLGEHRLKDLSAPERIFQLGEGEFPPLKTLYATNLPIPLTPFLGRERELAEVQELLARDAVRLLTLTGAGGSGKTRLALQAAGAAAEEYPQGVWWVALAGIANADDVTAAAARALGGGADLAEVVGDRRLLLLLDNFEHVIDAAAHIADVLATCPRVDVLVTSRERLRVQGEQVYPVPVLARAEARELFVTRARAAAPQFEPDEHVDELCERLDDLPLALELAAARVSMLSTEQLLSRLGQRLDLLRGGRDAEVRQQTLRATIEWSYGLLQPDEQRLLNRLASFRGGCTLEAAEEICGASLDQLESLVDKSLVRVREGNRFWMLETIREFALERLRESGEEDAIGRKHAEYFLTLAERADLSVEGIAAGRGDRGYVLVLPEQENLRAALERFVATDDVEAALRLAVALEQYWVSNSPFEGRRRLSALLSSAQRVPDELRVRLIRALGGCTYILGDFEEGTRLVEEALEVYRRLGDESGISHMLYRVAIEANRAGERERARALTEESLARDPSAFTQSQGLRLLGAFAFGEGRHDDALELLDHCVASAAEIGFVWWQTGALEQAAEYALVLGRLEEARSRLREALPLARSINDRMGTVYALALLAWLAVASGRLALGGRLWGAVDSEAARGRIGQWEAERTEYAARIVSDDPEFDRGYAAGRTLSLDEAVEHAFDES